MNLGILNERGQNEQQTGQGRRIEKAMKNRNGALCMSSGVRAIKKEDSFCLLASSPSMTSMVPQEVL